MGVVTVRPSGTLADTGWTVVECLTSGDARRSDAYHNENPQLAISHSPIP